jgi:hypothetical protein
LIVKGNLKSLRKLVSGGFSLLKYKEERKDKRAKGRKEKGNKLQATGNRRASQEGRMGERANGRKEERGNMVQGTRYKQASHEEGGGEAKGMEERKR